MRMTRALNLLQSDRDGFGFVRAHPDRQIAIRIRLSQHDQPLRRHQADAHTVDHNFYHIRHGGLPASILA
jgi:hypothetical protein